MGAIDHFQPSLLLFLEKEQKDLPLEVQKAYKSLTSALREAVQQNYEDLDGTLEHLLSKIWKLRFQVLPFLLNKDISLGLNNVQVDLSLVSEKYPALHPAAEKLSFGLKLMKEFVLKYFADHPTAFHEPETNIYNQPIPDWKKVVQDLEKEDGPFSSLRSVFHGSLMIEVLLFAIDDVVNNNITLEPAMCYELDYQSAVAVKEYAVGLGMKEEQLPWYQEPQNEVEKLLLTGPVLSDSDLEHVFEKRRHLNAWKCETIHWQR